MNSDTSNDSESSLPTRALNTFPSSPPAPFPPLNSEASFEKALKMDFKSEPLAPKHERSPRPAPRRISSEDTERPPSAQQLQRNEDDHADQTDEEPEDESDADPAKRIEDFDWDDLHHRYEVSMQERYAHEDDLAEEWETLMNVYLHMFSDRRDADSDTVFPHLG
jgi:hypothetical protein